VRLLTFGIFGGIFGFFLGEISSFSIELFAREKGRPFYSHAQKKKFF
jgi:hypothetical protein